MCTYVILSTLLASTVLAVPNPVGISHDPHFQRNTQPAPFKRDVLHSSVAYGALPEVATTTTVTVLTTITVSASIDTSTSTSTSTLDFTSRSTTTTPTVTSSPEPEPVEEKAGVYICEDHNWGGNCEHKLTPLGSSDDDCTRLDGTASSIGPDVGFKCLFYTNSDCRPFARDGSDFVELTYPGNANLLVTDKGDYNDKLYSYLCFKLEL